MINDITFYHYLCAQKRRMAVSAEPVSLEPDSRGRRGVLLLSCGKRTSPKASPVPPALRTQRRPGSRPGWRETLTWSAPGRAGARPRERAVAGAVCERVPPASPRRDSRLRIVRKALQNH